MAFAMPISYNKLLNQKVIGSKGFTSSFSQTVVVPDGPHVGNITVTVLSAAIPASISEGTQVTNLAVTVATALTFVDTQLTMSLMPSQSKSFFTKPENLMVLADNHADGFTYAAGGAMIADMWAATPGKSVTLPDGQGNMSTDGTVAEGHENISKLMELIAYIQTQSQPGTSVTDYGIIAYADTLANLVTLRSDSYKAIFDSATNMWTFLGIPIYVTQYATNFGVASRSAAFVYHREAGAIVFDEPMLIGGGPVWHDDAMLKWTSVCPYGHGLFNTELLGELLNLAAI